MDINIINISELFRIDYSLLYTAASHKLTKNGYQYSTPKTGRRLSGINTFTGCNAEYYKDNRLILTVRKGDMVYLPQNSIYTVKTSQCRNESEPGLLGFNEVLMNFGLLDEHGDPFSLADTVCRITMKPERINYYYSRIIALAASELFEYNGLIKALLYELLTDFSVFMRSENITSGEYSRLHTAIRHIERNYASKKLSIRELADICHISESCFRRLFMKYSGVTPARYIAELRIARANTLLRNTGFNVREIASLVGFDDPFYFSRFYKKNTGNPPSLERETNSR